MSRMDDKDKMKVMEATIQTVFDLLQRRLTNNVEAVNAISIAPMDNLSEKIKEMREVEAGKIRAVMQEQKDLITILKALFPSNA